MIAAGKQGFPKDQANLVKSWMFIHQKELEENFLRFASPITGRSVIGPYRQPLITNP